MGECADTDDLDQRLVWFQRLTKQLESIFKQYSRAVSDRGIHRFNKRIGLPAIEDDKIEAKAASVFDLGVMVASHLGSLGFTDEAIFHLRRLLTQSDKPTLEPAKNGLRSWSP